MPLSPEKQRARRARIKRLQDSKVIRRKRCANDGELFTPTRLYPVQKFCCDNCRKEFHKNGGNAFGPLKSKIEGMIQKHTNELVKRVRALERELATQADISEFNGRLEMLELAIYKDEIFRTANEAHAEATARAGGK